MKACGASDKGAVREDNQDSFLMKKIGSDSVLLVLCDGMGGAAAGAVASSLACKSFADHVLKYTRENNAPDAAVILKESAAFANIMVYEKSRSDESCRGMGTTLVSAFINGNRASILNIGDSRCYCLSHNILTQITEDHSLVSEMVKTNMLSPEEAKTHPQKNIITRAVGIEYREKADMFEITLVTDDILLLCSDGLSNMLDDKEIELILNQKSDLKSKCSKLISCALAKNAHDNVTAVLLQR